MWLLKPDGLFAKHYLICPIGVEFVHLARIPFDSGCSARRSLNAGQELAPAFARRRTGCCGVIGPFPQPLWIRCAPNCDVVRLQHAPHDVNSPGFPPLRFSLRVGRQRRAWWSAAKSPRPGSDRSPARRWLCSHGPLGPGLDARGTLRDQVRCRFPVACPGPRSSGTCSRSAPQKE